MRQLSPQSLWWDTITGAVRLKEQMINGLYSQKIAFLKYSFPLPFVSQLQESLYEAVLERNREVQFPSLLDLSDFSGETSVEDYFLKKVADSSQIDKYRSSEKVADFLEKHQIIQNKFFWVEGISPEHYKEWDKFFRSFSAELLEDCFFVIPWHNDFYLKEGKRFQILDYGSMVHYHDTRLFCHLLLDQQMGEIESDYFSSALAHLSGNDGELVVFFIDHLGELKENPASFVEKNLHLYTHGYEKEDFGTDHLVSCGNSDFVKNKLWKAQLEVLLPLLELIHRGIIRDWERVIADYLEENEVRQFHVKLKHPYEVEFGTLHYMAQSIPEFTPQVRDDIRFLRKCRNYIAHGDVCSSIEVQHLLKEYSK